MPLSLPRAYAVELLGTFALVFVSAGVVCVQCLTTPAGETPAASALLGHQPGLVGVALAAGLSYTALLGATVPAAGGYLNPAVTVLLWACNRMPGSRAAWLLGAQLAGAALAGLCLRYLFADDVLREARFGTPHLNRLAYPGLGWGALLSGAALELALTFVLVLAMFGAPGAPGRAAGPDPNRAGLAGGLTLTAAVLLAFPLTGAALNPARWFGPAFWEWAAAPGADVLADAFVYCAGPVVGALLGGAVCFRLMAPPGEIGGAAKGS